MDTSSLVAFLLQLRSQTKLWHWQTHSFAQHKALDEYEQKLNELTDEMVETISGTNERPHVVSAFPLSDLRPGYPEELYQRALHFFRLLAKSLEEEGESDLANIAAELAGQTRKLLYLLSLE